MISESINTLRTLEKDFGQPRWPKPEKRGFWPGSTILLKIWKYQKMGMILLMIGYHKGHSATGSIIKRCNFNDTGNKQQHNTSICYPCL